MIGIIATFDVQDGKQAEFETVAKDLMAKVKANEAGCLTYQLYKQEGSDTVYLMMEQYASAQAVTEHTQAAYYKDLGPKLGPCLVSPPNIQKFDIVE
ncbi:MAG: putative quinol monooxygenase [Henriciella sp.]